jgi:two-component system, NarL family, sensor histidine kinase DesK
LPDVDSKPPSPERAATAGHRRPIGGRGRYSLVYRVAAAVFVAYPVVLLVYARPPLPEIVLALTGTALFVALLGFASSQPRSPRRSSWVGPLLVIALLIVATVLLVSDPSTDFYPFYFFASAGASALLPPRRAMTLVAISGLVATVALWWVSGEPVTAVVQGVSVGIIGVTIFNAAELRRANRQLVEARDELNQLAVTAERARIARDLHDSLGQSLSVITLKSQLAAKLISQDPERARLEMVETEQVARDALSAVRETVGGQRQPTLDGELAAARQALAAAEIVPTIEAIAGELPPQVDAALAWTVREAVTNVVRHSQARRVTIRIHKANGWAEATIIDDGSGAATKGSGFGLLGLSERISALGGRFSAGPAPSGGFQLDAALPLKGAAS